MEEAHRLHQENPNGTPDPARAEPLVEPDWDPDSRGLVHLAQETHTSRVKERGD